MIDYRELLMKYISHVGACESVIFLSSNYSWSLEKRMTKEDINELEILAEESRKYDSTETYES